jgi:hypothetical protein
MLVNTFSTVLAPNIDLAGIVPTQPTYLQIRGRINTLIDRYLNPAILTGHVTDLAQQFTQPHTRLWEAIDWQAIHLDQIIGIEPQLFLNVIASIVEIEAPIISYAKESHDYFAQLNPLMAEFMGGEWHTDGSLKRMGTWAKEERQHAPAFTKIYQRLTGERLQPIPNTVLGYQPSADPWADLHHHVQSRITTEWSAASIYLWLMAHSTGALQQAIAQPFQDELNHLAKFWGFSRWAFGDSYLEHFKGSAHQLILLSEHHQQERSHGTTIVGQAKRISHLAHILELSFTFLRVMVRLRQWNQTLPHRQLQQTLGRSFCQARPILAIAA